MKYFDRFPLVNYNGAVAKNILTKVDLTKKSKQEVQSKFDYVLDENVNRPDLLSYVTYNSSYYDWMIFLTNNIIDPYHDYYKTEEVMKEYIANKYSSLENALDVILYYRNNWASDTTQLTVAQYDALEEEIKKYYTPFLNNANQVIYYTRLQEDWIMSTNRIYELTVDDATWVHDYGPVTQSDSSANIVSVDRDNNIVIINHVEGDFVEGEFLDTEITNISLMARNIPEDEESFWSPVSAYDYETEENELKRYISLIRNSYLRDVDQDFVEQIKS